jgi:hypothetical protein
MLSTAVAKAPAARVTAMPASSTSCIRERPLAARAATTAVVEMAPANAARASQGRFTVVLGWPRTTATRTPRTAPAEVPTVLGVASGLLNTSWYAAPTTESVAPTSAAISTRGTRSCQSTKADVSDRGEGRRTAPRRSPRR